jgi:hypothetical protein
VESPDTLKRVIGQQLTDEVVAALDQLFPEKTPELNDSIDQIRYASGQRSVIRFLKGIVEG